MDKKRIALITTWFPPQNGVAVNRMSAFAKYLSNVYDVDVYTLGKENKIKKEDFGTVYYCFNPSILDRIKHKSTDSKLKHHTKTVLNIVSIKLNLSALNVWKKQVTKLLKENHKKKNYDILISSFSPVEPHDIAFSIKSEFNNLIWVADMRDEMSSNPFMLGSTKKKMRKKELRYEPFINAITTVSQPILEDFKTLFPNLKFFEEIRNGFDHDIIPVNGFNKEFTLVYAGTFYGKRKPDVFFQVLKDLIQHRKIDKHLKIKFIGSNHNFNIPVELNQFVEFVPSVSYHESIEFIKNADCNLLFNPPLGTKGQFSGKIFDYISVEKPILAMVDKDDVAAELIREHNAGIVCDFYNKKEIENALLEIYQNWLKKEVFPVNHEKTASLHRKAQVKKLSDLIQKLVEK